jgi:hypothetical protein
MYKILYMLSRGRLSSLALPHEVGASLAGVAGLISGFKLANWLAERMHHANEATHPVILRHTEHYIYPANTVSQA